jgi:hypothetical protein
MIGMLSGIAAESIGHASLARVLDTVSLTNSQAATLEAQFPRSDWALLFQRGWFAERTAACRYLRRNSHC